MARTRALVSRCFPSSLRFITSFQAWPVIFLLNHVACYLQSTTRKRHTPPSSRPIPRDTRQGNETWSRERSGPRSARATWCDKRSFSLLSRGWRRCRVGTHAFLRRYARTCAACVPWQYGRSYVMQKPGEGESPARTPPPFPSFAHKSGVRASTYTQKERERERERAQRECVTRVETHTAGREWRNTPGERAR